MNRVFIIFFFTVLLLFFFHKKFNEYLFYILSVKNNYFYYVCNVYRCSIFDDMDFYVNNLMFILFMYNC